MLWWYPYEIMLTLRVFQISMGEGEPEPVSIGDAESKLL